MPRPTKAKSTVSAESAPVVETVPVPVVETVVETVPVPVPVVKAPRVKKEKAVAVVAPVVEVPAVVAPVVEVVEQPAETVEEGAPRRQRAVHSRETVLRDFAELVSNLESEITTARAAGGKAGAASTKTLRRVLSSVKDLQRATSQAIKTKPVSQRKNNHSGFLKPVQISGEIAKFTGFDASQLHSRVDVNNYICEYIKKNNLQNPEDRRQILPDEKLAKVIGYTPGTDKPLTYPVLQQFMTRHYPSSKTA